MKKLSLACSLLVMLVGHVAGAKPRPNALGPAQVDSLEAVLRRHPQPDTVRVRAVITLIKAYRDTNPNRRQALLNEALPLAQRLGYQHGIGRLYLEQGVVDKNAGRMDAARHSDSLAMRALRLAGDSSGVASALDALGSVNLRESRFDAAAKLYTAALRLHEKYSVPEVRATSIFNLGSVMLGVDREPQAIAYFKQYLGLVKPKDNPRNVSIAYRALALAYNNTGRYAEALASAKKALPLVAQEPNEQSQIFNILGSIEDGAGHYDESAEYQRKAVALSRRYGSPRELAYALLGYGDAQLAQQQPVAALLSFGEAQRLGEKIGDLTSQQHAHIGQTKANRQLGRYQEALSHAESSAMITDSVLNETNLAQVNELQTQYETEKKEAQNRLQAARLKTQEQVIRRRNTQLAAGVAVVLLLAGLAWALYHRRRLQAQVALEQERQQLTQQRAAAVLEAEEAERRRIGSDLHDGVGQLLTAARLNLSALSEQLNVQTEGQQAMLQNALEVVDESFREVRSISHNLMPNALIKRGLAQAVRDFLQKIAPDGRLKVQLEVVGLDQGGRLEPTVENVLFRVIQELVQNIIKHAHATEVTLQLIRSETDLTVVVEDNGVGFDPAALGEEAGIGLKNIESRMAYLGGRAEFDAALGRGTTVVLEIPMVAGTAS